MKYDVSIADNAIIPAHELEISVSKSGGPGGQHTNKTSTRITVRWNVRDTQALSDMQKERVLNKLSGILTTSGDLIIHSSVSRSQQRNKEEALDRLGQLVRKALYIPKKRMKTKIPYSAKEGRLQTKMRHSTIKKARSKILYDE